MLDATGLYRLDETSVRFFGTHVLRILQRGEVVVGRFGRRGTIKGTLHDFELRAAWRERACSGWLNATFDPTYDTFRGECGDEDDELIAQVQCTGTRIRRSF